MCGLTNISLDLNKRYIGRDWKWPQYMDPEDHQNWSVWSSSRLLTCGQRGRLEIFSVV